jgi:hypothetical protein
MVYPSRGFQSVLSSILIVSVALCTLTSFLIQSHHPLRRRLQAKLQHTPEAVPVDTMRDTSQVVSLAFRQNTSQVVSMAARHNTSHVVSMAARHNTSQVVSVATMRDTPQVVSVDHTSRTVHVGLLGWAGNFDLGTYSCPLTRCIYHKYERGQMDYDVLLNPYPSGVPWPSKMSSKTRHADLNIESFVNHASVETHRNDVDVDIRYQPLKNGNGFPFIQTSYIQAEMNAFMARDKNDNRWLGYEFRDPAMAVVISNCNTRSKRMHTLDGIVKGFSRVYKFGRCFEGHQRSLAIPETLKKCLSLPRSEPVWDKPKECILQNVMFSFSIENSFEYGYITEKLWQALQMGAIPVYALGVLKNREFLPHPDSALIVEDFESIEKLAVYMQQVSTNKTLWFKHAMAWRYLPTTELSKQFISVVNNSLFTLPCRLCDWWSVVNEKNGMI